MSNSIETILAQAESERERLQGMIAAAKKRLDELDVFVKVYRQLSLHHQVEAESGGQDVRSLSHAAVRLRDLASGVATSSSFQVSRGTSESLAARAASRAQTRQITEFFAGVLSDGIWRTTNDLYDKLVNDQIELTAQHKMQRVSQILSSDPRFINDRSKGWSLASLQRPRTVLVGEDATEAPDSDEDIA